MIVAIDFLDHWRTRLLVTLLGDDEFAPMYLLRLWAHCQSRKKWVFDDLPTAALKGICRYAGDAEKLESALLGSGFVGRNGGALEAVGWSEYNATLIASWANGKTGGRPRGSKAKDSRKTRGFPTGNPRDTQDEPTGIPSDTHGEPVGNPRETHGYPTGNPPATHGVTDKRREDKTREEPPPTPPLREGEGGGSRQGEAADEREHPAMPTAPPTPQGRIALLLRSQSISCNPGSPTIASWIESGLTDETLLAAIQAAKDSKRGEAISLGYVNGILRRWAKEQKAAPDISGVRAPARQGWREEDAALAAELTGGIHGHEDDRIIDV